ERRERLEIGRIFVETDVKGRCHRGFLRKRTWRRRPGSINCRTLRTVSKCAPSRRPVMLQRNAPGSQWAQREAVTMTPRTPSRYAEVYQRACRDPEGFWAQAAADIDWLRPADKVFDPQAGVYGRWFVGALCNTCFNAVDRHVASGRGAQPALI